VTISRGTPIVIALFLVACANHEGQYEPACIAYEGDRIELKDGRFEWHRFTDQRTVDKSGNTVDPFPNFPKTGAYKFSDSRLLFSTSDGTSLDEWFVVTHAGDRYLLTPTQHNAFSESNEMPDCALKLAKTDS